LGAANTGIFATIAKTNDGTFVAAGNHVADFGKCSL
jgi:hypothetical protein